MTDSSVNNFPKIAIRNRQEIEQSQNCGCYNCIKIFSVNEVVKWTDQNRTALCPFCSVDSLIPDSVVSLNEEILTKAQKYWF